MIWIVIGQPFKECKGFTSFDERRRIDEEVGKKKWSSAYDDRCHESTWTLDLVQEYINKLNLK